MATATKPPAKPPAKKPAPVNPYATNPAGFSAVQQLLTSIGLGSLSTWALQQMQHGATADDISVGIRQTKQWQSEFGDTILARQKAGLPPISEAEVISYRDTAFQTANKYAIPQGVVTKQLVDQWIADDKSVSEMDTIMNQGVNAVIKAPPEVRNAFSQYFGVGKGDAALAAYFMDPSKAEPVLLQQAQAAQFGGNAARYGINLSSNDAMTLAQAGTTQDRAMTGFQDVDKLSALFQDEVGDTTHLGKAQGVEADILGNAQELDKEQQKLSARAAGAKGKVGVEENPQKGFEGLGASF